MIVLYRVRRGIANEQLRYSLRSLSNLGDGHHEVWMIGRVPPWIRSNVHCITGRPRDKWHALVHDLHTAALDIGQADFVLMDDDFFVLSPVAEVPVLHAGLLRDHAATKRGSYQRSMLATANALELAGCAEPVSYELHAPMTINAPELVSVIEPALYSPRPLQARSLYGNSRSIGGHQAPDVKVMERGVALPLPFASTSPSSWSYLAPAIKSLLTEPSCFE